MRARAENFHIFLITFNLTIDRSNLKEREREKRNLVSVT